MLQMNKIKHNHAKAIMFFISNWNKRESFSTSKATSLSWHAQSELVQTISTLSIQHEKHVHIPQDFMNVFDCQHAKPTWFVTCQSS